MTRRLTRRAALGTAGTTAVASLSGCIDQFGGGEPDGSNVTPLPVPTIGDEATGVTVTVFEDFACPHCRTFNEEVYPRIREEYVDEGVVAYRHRDFPIPVDETVSWQAPNAARAIQDAIDAAAFFEYAEALFANQDTLGPDTYESLAEDFDVDPAEVRSAAEDRTYDATLERDRQHGADNGVQGTPTVWVDGDPVEGNDFETISAAIETARRQS